MHATHCRPALLILAGLLLCCASTGPKPPGAAGPPPPPQITLSIVGTSDLHGHVEPTLFTVKGARQVARGGLPLLGGYLANLRRVHPVVLLDAGDLFQGTLVSNLNEGQVVIDAYNALGYTAAAIGNHEFDYGPAGPRAVPRQGSDDDPAGALKARIAAARFPFLAANVLDSAQQSAAPSTDSPAARPVAWPNVFPARLVKVAGVPIGLIGATAEDTPRTTNALNLRGLSIGRVVPAVTEQARLLRQQGAAAIILVVHEGGDCKSFADPHDLHPCESSDGRILTIARALAGQVDAIVGGHSHAGVAHFVDGIPVVQSFMGGRAFGRIDLTLRQTGTTWQLDKERTRIFPPQEVCDVMPRQRSIVHYCDPKLLAEAEIEPATYEGAPVTADPAVAAIIAPYAARAAARRAEPLGVTLSERLPRRYREEAPLSQALADLIRQGAAAATHQQVDVGLQNGGGVRADLPTGALNYGDLYEVLPFDNRLAILRLTGAQLAELFRLNLTSNGGILVPSGVRVSARCQGQNLEVSLSDPAGRPISPTSVLRVATSDFLASGGDNFGELMAKLPPGAVTYYDEAPPLREIVIEALKRQGFPARDKQRISLPGPTRPIRCGAAQPADAPPA